MGRIEIGYGFSFDEESHRYFRGGVPVVGLTQAIRLTGFVDDSWFTDEAGDRGTRTHAACQFLAEDDLDWTTVADDIRPRVEAFRDFLATYQPTLLYAEKFFPSPTYGFACRIDFLFDVPALGGVSILEVKTGSIGLAAKLQTAGQKIAIEESSGLIVARRYGFGLTKEGRYVLKPFTDAGDRAMLINAVGMVNRRVNEGELKL